MVETQKYYQKETLSEKDMLSDPEFLNDSFSYMIQRTNKRIHDPKERFDKLMELMRISQVNEINAIENLTHAKRLDNDEDKALMGKMFLAYDKYEGATGFWDHLNKVLDYGEGLATSPATIGASLLAVPTLGGSLAVRGGAQVGVRATNIAVRKIIEGGLSKFVKQQALRSAGRAAAVEAPLGALLAGTEAAARRETGREEFEDIDVLEESLLGGAIGGATAGILGGAVGAIAAKARGFKGLERLDKFYTTRGDKVKKGIAQREKQIKDNPEYEELIDDIYNKTKKPLDPTIVAAGEKISRSIMPVFSRMGRKPRMAREGLVKEGDKVLDEPFRASLTTDVMKNASAAALEIMRRNIIRNNKGINPEDLIKQLKTTRITEVLHNVLSDTVEGKYLPKVIEEIDPITGQMKRIEISPWEEIHSVMKDYGLTPTEFSSVYMAEVSNAARVLQIQSQSAKEMKKLLGTTGTEEAAKLSKMYDELSFLQKNQNTPVSEGRLIGEFAVPQEYLDNMKIFSEMVEKASPDRALKTGWTILKNLDKTRLALMTIQPATTIRNTANGTARLPIYALDNLFHGAMTGDPKKMLAGPRVIGSMLNPTEAQMLKIIFSDEMPQTFPQLYRKAADIEEAAGKKSSMVQVGRWLNGMNTYTDNAFKRVIFMSELSNRVGKKVLFDHMANGRFTEIPNIQKHIDESMQEALSFAYQRGFKTKEQGAGWWENNGNKFLKAFSKPPHSFIVPFPRFTANSIEFMYKHAPLIGLMDFPKKAVQAKFLGPRAKNLVKYQKVLPDGKTKSGKQVIREDLPKDELKKAVLRENIKREKALAKETKIEQEARESFPKRIANQLTGMGMLYGAIQLRAHQGPDATWWEMYDRDTDTYRAAMAFYGPFAVYMLAADVIIKSSNFGKNLIGVGGKDLKEQWENTAKKTFKQRIVDSDTFADFLRAVAGPQFKTGMGADWVRSIQDSVGEFEVATRGLNPEDPNYQTQLQKKSNRGLDMVAGAVGNLAATFLVPMGAVRDVMAGFDPKEWEGAMATDYISPADLFIKKALRALPISKEGKIMRVFSVKNGAQFVPWPFEGEGTEFQPVISSTKPPYEESYKRKQGFRRQMTGLTSPATKNALEKELERQGLKAYKLFPRIPQSSELTRVIRQYYQTQIDDLNRYVMSKKYQDLKPELKAGRLEAVVKNRTKSPLQKTQSILVRELQKTEAGTPERKTAENKLAKSLQVQFGKMNDDDRTEAILDYRKFHSDKNPNFDEIGDLLKVLTYARKRQNIRTE